MNLIIDIGNSRTKTAIFEENRIIETRIFDELMLCDVELILKVSPGIQNAILSSTKEKDEALLTYLTNTIPFFLELTDTTPLPFTNLYETKKTQGTDRIAVVAGAQFLYSSKNILIIDAGTAITYEFINAADEYAGGNISPGLSMRYKALHTFTQKLPLLESKDETMLLGKNTETAIIAGVQHGIIFEMEAYIEKLSKSYNDLVVILTGGDCVFFANKLKNTIFVNQNLLLIGLNRILEYNAKL